MASDESLANLSRLRVQGASVPLVVPKMPALPPEVVKRFPTLKQYEEDLEKWRTDLATALGWTTNT